ncbi:MAG: glycosyltransferase [Anaerolineaceae bacterium]|nr:glycosyltransferase [Anaerolineaceae bacterium]
MPDVSIVIVNYNTCEPLRRCLQSIQTEAIDLDVEVIVVDNGSKDDSAAMVSKVMPQATVIEPGQNTWFSGGNNLGFQQAKGDFIYILNADTRLQPNGLQTMLAYLKAHPNVGAVTCRMEYPEGGLQHTCSRVPAYIDLLLGYTFLGVLLKSWRDRRRHVMWYTGWNRDSGQSIEVGPGSNLLCTHTVIEQIAGFDEQLKLYFTEDDLCKKILDAGFEIHFVEGALLLHEERASTSQIWRMASYIYFEDLLIFCRKYYGDTRAFVLRALMLPTRIAMNIAQRLRGERTAL